jgi:hypothetical protein
MMLGDVLREARRAAAGGLARDAVASFERYASEEDWATLLSSIRRADDPGKACLEAMVRWKLARLGPRPAALGTRGEET